MPDKLVTQGRKISLKWIVSPAVYLGDSVTQQPNAIEARRPLMEYKALLEFSI
jgi:hypothetical protein